MKKGIYIFLIFLFSIDINSQGVNANFIGVEVDTLYLFSPFGSIVTINNDQRQISPEYTGSVGDTLRKLIIEQIAATNIL